MADPLVVVIDESMPKRLRTELVNRGRQVRSYGELGLGGLKDPEVLETMALKSFGWVLLNSDDRMPHEHEAVLQRTGATLAIVDPRHPEESGVNEWKHDVAHRWVHAMQTQRPGTWVRYGINSHRLWTLRRHR